MTVTDRERQRVIDVVTVASLDGIDEAEMYRLVRAGLDAAGRITAARVPIDWDALPTIGSAITR
jgi:hypothetical protein